jgi:hypothetical protein
MVKKFVFICLIVSAALRRLNESSEPESMERK